MKLKSRWGLICCLLLLSACAPKTELPRILWPVPPEQPRLEWLGVYYNDETFPDPGERRSLKALESEHIVRFFKSPFDIAADGKGLVYVTDLHLRDVFVFDFNKRTVKPLFRNPRISQPMGIDIDQQGVLYITDPKAGKIWITGPDGIVKKVVEDRSVLLRPTYICVDEQRNRMLVSDTRNDQVVVFSLDGEYQFSFGTRGSGDGQFMSPQGVAVDGAGQIFVADMLNARIQVFDTQGNFVHKFGERGDQVYQFENPKDLGFDSEGNLYVADDRKAMLLTYSPKGRLLLATGDGARTLNPLGFASLKGIFVGHDDVIYIADQLNGRFSMYQYLSKQVLDRYPITEADKQKLQEYLQSTDLAK